MAIERRYFNTVDDNNEGRVKISGSGGVEPSFTLVADTPQNVDYGVAALDFASSPTTEWPENISSPSDSDIWDSSNVTLIENTILGQLHIWRVILDYSGKSNNDVASLDVSLSNPLSGFITNFTLALPEGRTSDTNQSAILATIADGASLPAPLGTGQGYNLQITSNKALTVTIKSVTRISTFHNKRP